MNDNLNEEALKEKVSNDDEENGRTFGEIKENNSLVEIGRALDRAESVYIFPHILMDGDAFGSAAALCRVLRERGKEAWILLEDRVPDYLKFLDEDFTTHNNKKIKEPDICLALDCGEENRFPGRVKTFRRGKMSICIDHHPTSKPVFDMNYIDPGAAATGEIVYKLLKEMGAEISAAAGEALFAAITTDTGDFQYSNTTKESHLITAELYDTGMDSTKVSIAIYQCEPPEKILLHGKVMSDLDVFAEGRGIIACVTQKMLEETGARMEHTEGIVSQMRAVKGVDIAALLKENENGEVKVSMRVKDKGDVSGIAGKYGGGGHVKAAGCAIKKDMEEVCEIIKYEISRELEKQTSVNS